MKPKKLTGLGKKTQSSPMNSTKIPRETNATNTPHKTPEQPPLHYYSLNNRKIKQQQKHQNR
jgi:hypothetical protein